MSSASPSGALQSEWARLLLESFSEAGVRDVVLSPGSRSTPFVLAAIERPELRVYDVVDERSAAFFALGQARATSRPSLLLCTSGTAAANYLPAVIEASASYLPLLVVSADRPQELRGCGANQTIDQLKLFGDHVRFFADLGAPDPAPLALRALRRVAAQAVFATLHPRPGAVHLNAPAKKPLEPPVDGELDEALTAHLGALRRRAAVVATPPRLVPPAGAVGELAALLGQVERGVIACGPAPLSQAEAYDALFEVARASGYPVLADAASQMRFRTRREESALFVDSYPFLLGDEGFCRRHRPELVIQIGRAPTTAAWQRYVESNERAPHWVLSPHGWNDPASTATGILAADVGETLGALKGLLGTPRRTSDWARSWKRADELAEALLEDELSTDAALTEGALPRDAVAALPRDGLLVVGNSLPIRRLDAWTRGGGKPLLVASQRGASGIDGIVSGACGAAVASGRPTILLLGDLSFLHDLSGLSTARWVEGPLAVVVVQNRGGRIFEMLPLASHPKVSAADFERWTTPHTADLAAAAAVYGLPHVRVEGREALTEALREALATGGVTLVEAVVEPHGAVEQNRRIASRLAIGIAREAETV